jgi:hypothetical protein
VSAANGFYSAIIRVTPSVPLADRWYALGVTSLPPTVVATTTLADGSAAVRFRRFSYPLVRTVEVCEKDPPWSKLVVWLSEPIVYPADVTALVGLTLGGTASPCDVYSTTASALYLTCAGLTSSSRATVAVGAGLQSATMVPLAPAAFDIDVAALPAGSCRVFRPALP